MVQAENITRTREQIEAEFLALRDEALGLEHLLSGLLEDDSRKGEIKKMGRVITEKLHALRDEFVQLIQAAEAQQ